VKAALSASAIASAYNYNPETGSAASLALSLRAVPTYKSRFPVENSFAVAKGNAQLLAKLNASLAKLKADGTIKGIFAKYGLADILVN
jgi:polar amino acid transport system substrate-binding protein